MTASPRCQESGCKARLPQILHTTLHERWRKAERPIAVAVLRERRGAGANQNRRPPAGRYEWHCERLFVDTATTSHQKPRLVRNARQLTPHRGPLGGREAQVARPLAAIRG